MVHPRTPRYSGEQNHSLGTRTREACKSGRHATPVCALPRASARLYGVSVCNYCESSFCLPLRTVGNSERGTVHPGTGGRPAEPYFILNALRIIRCVDEARCEEIAFWEPRHGDPERVGHYRNVAGLKIDPTKVEDANIFRPWGWTVVLIVSERVKLAMEKEGLTGARFIEV
ncbi:imm11 family protein [Cystobacter fuscus]